MPSDDPTHYDVVRDTRRKPRRRWRTAAYSIHYHRKHGIDAIFHRTNGGPSRPHLGITPASLHRLVRVLDPLGYQRELNRIGWEVSTRQGELEQEIVKLEQTIKQVEWASSWSQRCPWCHALRELGHARDCARQRVVGAADGDDS